MNQSDLFSYLSAFVTIVLAVAIADMIQSTHRLIRARRRVRWDIVPLIFAATVAGGVISEFFSLWDLFAVKTIGFAQLLWMLLVPTLYALLAYSALPDDVPETGLSLRDFFLDERRVWAVIFGLAVILDVGRSVLYLMHNRAWLMEYASFVAWLVPPTFVALYMLGFAQARRWHVAGTVLLAAIATHGMLSWHITIKS